MKVEGSYVAITGANRGIGRAFAEKAAEKKAHLVLLNRTLDPELSGALTSLGALSVTEIKTDLSSREGVEKALKKLNEYEIDILFNNAGQLTGGLLETQNLDEIFQMLQVNVNALIQMTHGILPQMLKRKKGKIINHASVSGVMGMACASTYSASKFAVVGFTRCLRAELQGTNVSTLLLITPGIETRMFKEIPTKYGSNMNLSFLKGRPVGEYASKIIKAVEKDEEELWPSWLGASGIGVRIAKHSPELFETMMKSVFRR